MRVIDNGINMFQMPYVDDDGVARIWRLNPNWTFVIIGAVILVAVILDQVVHIVQAKRRVRRAGMQGRQPSALAVGASGAAVAASAADLDDPGSPGAARSDPAAPS
jgi:ribose transport system permease protein